MKPGGTLGQRWHPQSDVRGLRVHAWRTSGYLGERPRDIDMGMFDTIRFHGDDALACPAGHGLHDLQTKDLDCAMAEYVVPGSRASKPDPRRNSRDGGGRIAERGLEVLDDSDRLARLHFSRLESRGR